MNAPLAVAKETTALNLVDPYDAPSMALTPMQMAYQLAARGTDVATIKEMLSIGRSMEADQARRAFDAAMASAKAEIPVIRKNRHVGFQHKSGDGETDYWHEDLGEIARTIDPILGKHGLSYRYRSARADGRIIITCVLSHREGHFEETAMDAAPDASGKKNSIQQVGSAVTYLQRYTLKLALGLAATRDDDGVHSEEGPEAISEEQVMQLRELLEETSAGRAGHTAAFLKFMKVEAIDDINAKDFQKAVEAINSTRVK